MVLLLLSAASALAQDPPRPPVPDTLPRPDTLAADTLAVPEPAPQDSALPAVQFPAMPISPLVAAAGTEWVWDRSRLLREADASVLDMLERIPGITTFRAGPFSQPEAASLFGGTAGRIEIQLDGYVLDPLAASTFDLAQIPLGQLRELRVQRRLGLLRVMMWTEYPEAAEAYTRVEAGIGVPAANMFRGLFLVPHVIAGPLALGIERIDSDGINRREPAGLFAGWVKWAWTNQRRGVQIELLRGTLKREPESQWQVERVRQDVVVRARNAFSDALVAEAYVGRGQMEETSPGAEGEVRTDRESVQAGLRWGLNLPWLHVSAAGRYRSERALPDLEGELDLESRLGPLQLGALGSVARWEGAGTEPFVSVRAQIGPLLRASAFGEVTRGTRRAPSFDDVGLPSVLTDREGWRAGVSLDLGRAAGSIALVRLDQGVATPFGLPFDSAALPISADAAEGLEAHGRILIWRQHLALSSWITDWRSAAGWTYLPARSWRTALELHWLPLASGNLEIFGRAEAHMRGTTTVFELDPAAAGSTTRVLPSFTTADGYLQIRIIDVRIFIRWEDLFGNDIEELSDRIYRGQRIFYGVKWNLWN
jgi:hypothetical protein